MTANSYVLDHSTNTLHLLGESWSSLRAGQPNMVTTKSIMGLRSHQGALREIQVYCTSVAKAASLTLMTADTVHHSRVEIMAVNVHFSLEVASNVTTNRSHPPNTSDLPLSEFNQWHIDITATHKTCLRRQCGIHWPLSTILE
jgi:hypothetical protein